MAPDGAITRRGVCGGALAALAGSAVAVPMLVEAQGSDDRGVLELLLLIERTEAAFYSAALEAGILDGELREFAQVVRGHEREHLAVVEGALGSGLPAEPTFDFADASRMPTRSPARRRSSRTWPSAPTTGRPRNLSKKVLRRRGPDRLRRGTPRGLDPQHRATASGAGRGRHADDGGQVRDGAARARSDRVTRSTWPRSIATARWRRRAAKA